MMGGAGSAMHRNVAQVGRAVRSYCRCHGVVTAGERWRSEGRSAHCLPNVVRDGQKGRQPGRSTDGDSIVRHDNPPTVIVTVGNDPPTQIVVPMISVTARMYGGRTVFGTAGDGGWIVRHDDAPDGHLRWWGTITRRSTDRQANCSWHDGGGSNWQPTQWGQRRRNVPMAPCVWLTTWTVFVAFAVDLDQCGTVRRTALSACKGFAGQ